MYLYPIEIVAITLALISLMALVITTAVANARLTRSLKEWRDNALWWNAIADENKEDADKWRGATAVKAQQ